MKKFHYLFILLLFMFAIGCGIQTASPTSGGTGANEEVGPAVSGFSENQDETSSQNLLPLPSLLSGSSYGIGEPIPGGAADPFASAAFHLAAEMPAGTETAAVEQHNFGQITEEKARELANQFGFTGPLYIQQIEPEFAPPAGQEGPPIYTAFDGYRILNIGSTGLTYEDRSVVVDYTRQLSYAEKAPIVEAQLKAWDVLNFPYLLQELPTGDLAIYRLIDGIPTQQNEFNITLNEAGEVAYFDYQPLRLVDALGSYPLQTAESAWQQLQTAEGRAQARYQLSPAEMPSMPEFVNPRSWAPLAEQGQELHLYMTPMVFEATDGRGNHIMFGDMTLTGSSEEIAEIAGHLGDLLHLWGTIDRTNGGKNFSLAGYEVLETMEYLNLEGEIVQEGGQTVLHTVDNEDFILAAAPADIPNGLEVFVSAAGQRDTGAAFPVLDWNIVSEKVTYPDMPVDVANDEPLVIDEVTITSVELVHFTMYRDPSNMQMDISFLFVPVWKLTGETNDGQLANFWITAVSPDHVEAPVLSNATGSISGWVWHDVCATAMDGQPALTSAPEGCLEAASAIGDYRADGIKDNQEPILADLVVHLGAGACPAVGLAETVTVATDLSYSFNELQPGTYCVSIDASEEPNMSLLRPGIWTYPEVSEGTIGQTVELGQGESVFDINFGWDHQFLP